MTVDTENGCDVISRFILETVNRPFTDSHPATAAGRPAAAADAPPATASVDAHPGQGAPAHAPAARPLVAVLLTLTVVTGLVDAATYLGLGHVFAANMTGNVALLGFALAGGGEISILASLIALGMFLAGAAAGGLLSRWLAADRRRWVLTALVIETVGLCLAAGCAALAVSGYAIVALLAVAMGVRNATVRRLSVPDLTTTVLTLTLTGLAADAASGAGVGGVLTRRLTSVVAMLVGALAGAVLLRYGLATPLVGAASLLVLATLGFAIAGRGERQAA